MEAQERQRIVVTVVSGHTSNASRTFCWPELPPPLSVGSQGDWSVSAPGVASVHLWLQFDGQRLYAASAEVGVATYLRDAPLGPGWNEVPDGAELCFGQARLSVRRERVLVSAPAQEPPAPRPLSPVERAAAVPLPSFFANRRQARAERPSSGSASDRRRARNSAAERFRDTDPDSPEKRDSRRSRAIRLALLLPLILVPLILGAAWLAHSNLKGTEQAVAVAAPAPCSTSLPPAASITEPPRQEPPLLAPALPVFPPPVSLEAPVLPLQASSDTFAPTQSPTPGPLKAYPQNVANKPVPRIGEQPWLISDPWREHHERQLRASNRARTRVIFLGDSITEAWGMAPAYKDKFGKYSPLNLGIASDLTQNVLWRIEHGALDGAQPGVVVLMIGINNLAGGFTAEQTVAGVRAILDAVEAHLPQTPLLLLAILPARQNPTDPLRQKIGQANQLLAKLAEPPRVSVHDLGSLLLEPDGTISNAIMRDFLHPSALGYDRLSAALAPLIEAHVKHTAN